MDEQAPRLVDFGDEDFAAHLDLGAVADGDEFEGDVGYGYGHSDDGYDSEDDEEDIVSHEFEHERLTDPELGLAEEWENFMLFDHNSDAGVDLGAPPCVCVCVCVCVRACVRACEYAYTVSDLYFQV